MGSSHTMKLNRHLSYFFGFISFAVPVFVYLAYVQYLGFPDGYVTDLERAGRILYNFFLCISSALGIIFFYLGLSAAKQKTGRPLQISVIIYVALFAVIILVYFILCSFLDNGRGG